MNVQQYVHCSESHYFQSGSKSALNTYERTTERKQMKIF